MYWEEKVDSLKTMFPSSDFRVPFREWKDIFKKIENKFIYRDNLNYLYKNWRAGIKNQTLVRETLTSHLESELNKLDQDKNYWVVLVFGDDAGASQLIYDAKPQVIGTLIRLSGNSFFVIEKKYEWLTFFELNRQTREMVIFKSGNGEVPFDRLG